MIPDAWGWCAEMTQRDGTGREEEGSSGWGTRVHLWWTHVDVWQNQYNIKVKLAWGWCMGMTQRDVVGREKLEDWT